MTRGTVQMNGKYVHKDGTEMVVVSASSPEHDDFVELWEDFPASGFRNAWFGTWKEFEAQWVLKGSAEQLEMET